MNYWQDHTTVVITWKADASVPTFPGQRSRRNADGSLSIEYTQDELRAAVALMRSMRGEAWRMGDAAAYGRVVPRAVDEGRQTILL